MIEKYRHIEFKLTDDADKSLVWLAIETNGTVLGDIKNNISVCIERGFFYTPGLFILNLLCKFLSIKRHLKF